MPAHGDADGEKRLAHCRQHRAGADLAEIRGKQPGNRFLEAAGKIIVGGQAQQQQEHERHHHHDSPLDAVLDARVDDKTGDGQAHQGPEHHADIVSQHGAELGTGLDTIHPDKAGSNRLEQVPQHPAHHHRIDNLDSVGRQQAHAAHPCPARDLPLSAGDIGHGRGWAALAPPADEHLRHQDRDTDTESAGQVDQHEGGATVLPGNIGKAPDITQANGETHRGHEEGKAGRPVRLGATCCRHRCIPGRCCYRQQSTQFAGVESADVSTGFGFRPPAGGWPAPARSGRRPPAAGRQPRPRAGGSCPASAAQRRSAGLRPPGAGQRAPG